MSYAEAARESGPIGAKKIPEIAKPEQTTPHGHIEVIPESKLNEFQSPDTSKPDLSKVKDFRKEISKELDEAKHKGEDLLSKVIANLTAGYKATSKKIYDVGICASSQTKKAADYSVEELKNPVVATQALVAVSAVVGGYFAYLERHRIDYHNKVVLGIHGVVLTGLVLVDGYLFNKYYPKYK